MKTLLSILLLASLTLVNPAPGDVEIKAGQDESIEHRIDDTIAIDDAVAPGATEKNPPAEPESRQMRMAPAVYSGWPFDASEARRRQEETGKAIGRPIEVANSIGMKLRLIPAGEFMMGGVRRMRRDGGVTRVLSTGCGSRNHFIWVYTR